MYRLWLIPLIFVIAVSAGAGPPGGLPCLESAIDQPQPSLLTRFKERVKQTPGKIAAYQRDYWSQIRAKPSRFFIVERDTNLGARRFWSGHLLSNPYATIFNRPRQFSLPVTTVTDTLFLVGLGIAQFYLDEKNHESAFSPLFPVPGRGYLQGMVNAGAVNQIQADRIIILHRSAISEWSSDPSNGNIYLPRVEDFVKAGILGENELSKFNSLAHQVFNEAIKRNPDIATAFASLPGALNAALLAPGSPLGRKSPVEISLLTSAFFPSFKIDHDSEVEVGKQLLSAQRETPPAEQKRVKARERYENAREAAQEAQEKLLKSTDGDREELKAQFRDALTRVNAAALSLEALGTALASDLDSGAQVSGASAASIQTHLAILHELLERQELGIADATKMAEETLHHDKRITEKLERARSLLPAGHLGTAERMDIPSQSQSLDFEWGAGGKKAPLTDELERWRLLLHDPRFHDGAQAWKTFLYSDEQALAYLNSQVKALNALAETKRAIDDAARHPSQTKLAQALTAELFGLGEDGKVNPLLDQAMRDVSSVLPPQVTPEEELGCLAKLAGFWGSLYEQEAQWAAGPGSDYSEFKKLRDRESESRAQRYNAILEGCRSGK